MEEKWNECLEMIRQQVGEHAYEVWFSQIVMESYDEATNSILLCVPHRYVYEYLEEVRLGMLMKAIWKAFNPGVKLNYRIAASQVPEPATDMVANQPSPVTQDNHLAIANAKERMQKGLQHFLGDDAKWLPEYDEIADWLSDNRGRGLLLIGTSGLGKSLICQKILPVLLSEAFGDVVDVVNAREMGQVLDVLLQRRCVIIDNLGSEPVSEMVNYRKRRPFFELCDAAEQRGLLLIINTTLSTTRVRNPLYPQSIQERYGNEVLDRLRATTRVVELRGQSLRK